MGCYLKQPRQVMFRSCTGSQFYVICFRSNGDPLLDKPANPLSSLEMSSDRQLQLH
jgi:hypothetical protein